MDLSCTPRRPDMYLSVTPGPNVRFGQRAVSPGDGMSVSDNLVEQDRLIAFPGQRQLDCTADCSFCRLGHQMVDVGGLRDPSVRLCNVNPEPQPRAVRHCLRTATYHSPACSGQAPDYNKSSRRGTSTSDASSRFWPHGISLKVRVLVRPQDPTRCRRSGQRCLTTRPQPDKRHLSCIAAEMMLGTSKV